MLSRLLLDYILNIKSYLTNPRNNLSLHHMSFQFIELGIKLSTFSTNASCQLDVLGHDGYSLGVNSAQISVLEQTDQISLSCLLKSRHSRALETQIGLEILGDFTDQALEWELPDEKLCGFLVLADFSESDGSWPESVRLLHSSGGRS